MKEYKYTCDICGKEISKAVYSPYDFNDKTKRVLMLCKIEDICLSCRDLLINTDIKAKIKQMIQTTEEVTTDETLG